MTKRKFSRLRVICIVILLLITVLWLGFIFSNSLRNGLESGKQSHSVQELMDAAFAFVGLNNPINESFLRKLAHFGEFAILALLFLGDWTAFGKLTPSTPLSLALPRLLSAVPACFLCACIDETIQRFSVGRSSQFFDVLIDTSGALSATLLCMAAFFFFWNGSSDVQESPLN